MFEGRRGIRWVCFPVSINLFDSGHTKNWKVSTKDTTIADGMNNKIDQLSIISAVSKMNTCTTSAFLYNLDIRA